MFAGLDGPDVNRPRTSLVDRRIEDGVQVGPEFAQRCGRVRGGLDGRMRRAGCCSCDACSSQRGTNDKQACSYFTSPRALTMESITDASIFAAPGDPLRAA